MQGVSAFGRVAPALLEERAAIENTGIAPQSSALK